MKLERNQSEIYQPELEIKSNGRLFLSLNIKCIYKFQTSL